jgi:hypothetical protein
MVFWGNDVKKTEQLVVVRRKTALVVQNSGLNAERRRQCEDRAKLQRAFWKSPDLFGNGLVATGTGTLANPHGRIIAAPAFPD